MAKEKIDFQVGDGGSTYLNGDRTSYTVVRRKGKSIWCSADRVKLLESSEGKEGPLDATFEAVERPERELLKFMLKPDGSWREKGRHGLTLSPGRSYSYAPNI